MTMNMDPPIFVSVSTEPDNPHAARESVRYDYFVRRLLKADTEAMEALHIGLGIAGEVGEYAGTFQYSEREEELGDLWFYTQAALNHYQLTARECVVYATELAEVPPVFAMGMVVDCIKREYIYNKPRDLNKIKEALGQLIINTEQEFGFIEKTQEEVLQINALKLEKRYAGLVYSDLAAQRRADKPAGE